MSETIASFEFGPYRDDEGNRTMVWVTLTERDEGHRRVSFQGEVKEFGLHLPVAIDQSQGSAPVALKALWERWHLNDMKAGCSHQEERYRADPSARPTYRNEYVGSTGDTLSGPCSECGYRYGTRWLYEPLPSDIIEQILKAAKGPANA